MEASLRDRYRVETPVQASGLYAATSAPTCNFTMWTLSANMPHRDMVTIMATSHLEETILYVDLALILEAAPKKVGSGREMTLDGARSQNRIHPADAPFHAARLAKVLLH